MGNIIGEPFKPYVNKQIKLRQLVYGDGFGGVKRSQQFINYLNTRTAWVKMASSVSINPPTLLNGEQLGGQREILTEVYDEAKDEKKEINTYKDGEFILDNLGIPSAQKSELIGNGLARSGILFGGLRSIKTGVQTTDDENEFRDPTISGEFESYGTRFGRAGYNTSNSIFGMNNAYGVGGLEFGQQPMPGITGFDIKYLNRGALRKATVTLVAFNKFQFELIETLYLRLGFNMMVEWGNSHYLPNKQLESEDQTIIEQVGNTVIENNWFQNQGSTHLEMNEIVESYRKKYDGNYDGFMGKVTNFNWSFNRDLSYNITIDLVSLGDVIESLVVNKNTPSNKGVSADENRDIDTISNILSAVKANPDTYNTNTSNSEYVSFVYDAIQFADDEALEGRATDYGYYWRFGDFLKWFQDSICPKIKGDGDVYEKLVIDYDEETNIMAAYPNQFSIDPRVCIVRNEVGDLFNFEAKPPIFDKMRIWSNTGGAKHGKIMNIYLNFKLIEDTIKRNSDIKGNIDFYSFLQGMCDSINRALGSQNNLEVTLRDDVRIIIQDQNSIGDNQKIIDRFNQLSRTQETGSEERTELQEILVDQGLESELINIIGYNVNNSGSNFVRDFNFETKIGPKLQNMMSISATATGQNIDGTETAFSKWNSGLTDRFHQEEFQPAPLPVGKGPYLTTSSEDGRVELTAEALKEIDVANKQLKTNKMEYYVTECFGSAVTGKKIPKVLPNEANAKALRDGKELEVADTQVFNPNYQLFDAKFISKGSAIIKEFFKEQSNAHLVKSGSSSGTVGFIPLNLNLTIDGMSGIKNYQQIRVDTKFLPRIYTDELKFIVMSVSHKVVDNEWTSVLTAISQPIVKEFPGAKYEPAKTAKYNYKTSTKAQSGTSFYPRVGDKFAPPVRPSDYLPSQGFESSIGNPTTIGEARSSGLIGTDTLIIRNDRLGQGKFGASRGTRLHNGIDISTRIGQNIYAPITGKISSTKATTSSKLTGFKIVGENDPDGMDYTGYRAFLFYNQRLTDVSSGTTVKAGQRIATQLDLTETSGDYSAAVTDHVHFRLQYKSSGDYQEVDPTGLEYEPAVNFLDGKEIISTPEPSVEQIRDIYIAKVKSVWTQIRNLAEYKRQKKEWNEKPYTFDGDPYPLWKNYQWLEIDRAFNSALEYLNFESDGSSTVKFSSYNVKKKQIYIANQRVLIATGDFKYGDIKSPYEPKEPNKKFDDAQSNVVAFYNNGGDGNDFIYNYILKGDGGGLKKFGVDMYNVGDSQLDNDVEALDSSGRWNM